MTKRNFRLKSGVNKMETYNFKYDLNQKVSSISYSDFEYHNGWVYEMKVGRGGFISYMILFEEQNLEPVWVEETFIKTIE